MKGSTDGDKILPSRRTKPRQLQFTPIFKHGNTFQSLKPKRQNPSTLVITKLQVGVGGFILPALQSQNTLPVEQM